LARHAEALKDWDRAIELDSGADRGYYRLRRALTLARLKEHAQATAEANSLAEVKGVTSGDLYNLAFVFSLSAATAHDDTDKVEQYAARAVALLSRAVAEGYKNVEHMKKDSDLDALRQRDDFKKLVRGLQDKDDSDN